MSFRASAQDQAVNGSLTVNGNTTVSASTASTSPTTGALQVAGGVGIIGALNVGGTVSLGGGPSFSAPAQSVLGLTANYVMLNATRTYKVGQPIDGSHFTIYDLTGNLDLAHWDPSGNLVNAGNLTVSGTGTSSFAGPLHVSGQAPGSELGALRLTNSDSTGGANVGIEFQAAGNPNPARIVGVAPGGSRQELAFYTTPGADVAQERVRIDGSGNVGIGTIHPSEHLSVVQSGTYNVEGTAGISVSDTTTAINTYNEKINLGVDNTARIGYLQTQSATSYSAVPLVLNPQGGNVGVGTTTPAARLDVVGQSVPGSVDGLFFSNSTSGNLNKGILGVTSASFSYGGIGGNETALFNAATSPISIITTDNQPIKLVTNYQERVRISPGGAVGIGTLTPSAELEVNGDAKIDGGLTVVGGGNVGVGTNSPTSGHLQVQTDSNYPGIFLTGNQAGWGSGIQFANTASGGKSYGIYSSQSGTFCFSDNGVGLDRIRFESSGSLSLQPGSGNVGIGTTTPAAKLDVAGNTNIGGNLTVAGSFSASNYVASSGALTGGAGGLTLNAGGSEQGVFLQPSGFGGAVWAQNTNGQDSYPLRVRNGLLKANDNYLGFMLQTNDASDPLQGTLVLHGGDVGTRRLEIGAYDNGLGPANVVVPYGNLGVGTTAPIAALHIKRGQTSDTAPLGLLRLQNLFTAAGTGDRNAVGIEFANGDGGATDVTLAGIYVNTADVSTGAMRFYTWNGTTTAERMRINDTGNVGIGTNNPDALLSVKGRIHAAEVVVDSTITATDLKVQPTVWADDVLAPSHRLEPLSQVEREIKTDGHLPGIPSAKDVAANGVSLAEMQAKLLGKIEELTLRQIEQEKLIRTQGQQIRQLQADNAALRSEAK